MEKNSNNTIEHLMFARRFMIWCIGGGFCLALLCILICLGIIPVQVLKYDIGGSRGIIYNLIILSLDMELLSLLAVSVTGGLVLVFCYMKKKRLWKSLAIFLLMFILVKLAIVFYICSPALSPDTWGCLNLVDVSLAFILIGLMIIWFASWLVAFYKNEQIKFNSKVSYISLGSGIAGGICIGSNLLYLIM